MTQFPSLFPNALADQPQAMSTQAAYNQTKPTLDPFSNQTNNFGMQPHQAANYPQQQPNNPHPYYNTNNNNWYGNPSGQSAASSGCSSLSQSIIDHIRMCAQQSASPIFILPSSSLPNASPMPCQPQIYPPTCVPYPMPMAIYPPYPQQKSSSHECKCSSNSSSSRNHHVETSDGWDKECSFALESDSSQEPWPKTHQCKETSDGTICAKKNCPATIQLQAMISQMLGIQGIVAAAMTRILLRSVAGSNVRDSPEDIMARATRCLRQMSKEQLLRESKSCGELHALLGLFLTSQSTLARVIPILTTVQLKSNILKALIASLVNAKIMENQGCGAEAPDPLDPLLLELKPDDELRELLASLREKECEERVNVSFAANNPQRLIAESRLANVQRKLKQVEREMQRRRDGRESTDWNRSVGVLQHHSAPVPLPGRYDSPDPFVAYRVMSPKRLILKPHVGSPETTYRKPVDGSSSPFCPKPRAVDTLGGKEEKKCGTSGESKTGEDKKKSGETNKSECQCQIEDDCSTENKREDGDEMEAKEETSEDGKMENTELTDCDEYDDNEK